jgi:uncharacterized Tic20 family protein
MTESRPTVPARPLSPSDERLWSTLAHLGNIVGFLPSLLILLLVGPRSTRVTVEAREALNFGLTAFIGWVALWVLGQVLNTLFRVVPTGFDLVFGLLAVLVGLVAFALWVLVVVIAVVAAMRVQTLGTFRYPFALRPVR